MRISSPSFRCTARARWILSRAILRNRHNPSSVTYKHPQLANILDVTYGCIVYQEQVMQICRELAGFSYGQADLVRRAMSEKEAR